MCKRNWYYCAYLLSLPAWECGLKSFFKNVMFGAVGSLPAWECGLKYCIFTAISCQQRHSLRGSVDWNPVITTTAAAEEGHSLRGSVDWNYLPKIEQESELVTPCVGVWIEIQLADYFCFLGLVTPCVGVWIEIAVYLLNVCGNTRHSLRGSVDWNIF